MTNRILITPEIDRKFLSYEWRNGAAILRHVHTKEWSEIASVLTSFELPRSQLSKKGKGNKSEMAGSLDGELYKLGWIEKSFDTLISVDGVKRPTPTHSVDCYKGRVALEVEWNNKDPFYDRDLNNFRLLYDLQAIDVGVIVTRTTELQKWLNENHKMFGKKGGTYGTSTTHNDKLVPRILGGGAGGCPVVVFAIKIEAYVDDENN
jgi:Restriction endonuclease BglII